MRWIRNLDTGHMNGALPMADSVFADIYDETITDEQTMRAALASRAKLYNPTPEGAPDGNTGARAAEVRGEEEIPW